MPIFVLRNGNAYRLSVQVNGGGAQQTYNFDMSLQRHAYRYLEQAQAKPMNSVLHNAVTDNDIVADLRALGRQLEAKALGQLQPAQPFQPSLSQQLAGVYSARLAGNGVRDGVAAMEARIQSTLFGDYLVPSGRTYRVDNTSINFMTPANHCYPIAGPLLWAGVSQQAFAGAVAFRRLEGALENKTKKPLEIWSGLKKDPGAQGTQIFADFTGARTQFGLLPLPDRQRIVKLAGETEQARLIAAALMSQ